MNPFLVLFFLFEVIAQSWGVKPIDVYWNITNPIFSGGDFGSQFENVIELNKDTHPWEYDQVNIICPNGKNITERHIIYSVSKMEYDNCRIINPKPRIIAVCDQPRNFMYFTITFRSFSPSPMQMEFKPGQSYYFISTSSARDMQRRVGGWCSTRNMKMIFRVADQPHEQQAVERETQSRPAASPLWPGYWGYTEEEYREEYEEEADQENRVGRVVTKSGGLGRNTRLVTRHEEEEDSNALRLQSGGVSQSSPSLLLLLSLGTAALALVWL